VADQFLLSITVPQAAQYHGLLCEIAEGLLAQIGFDPSEAVTIVDAFRAGIDRDAATGARPCDAVFRTEAGQLVIVVTGAGRREWRLAHPLPAPD
jgi:hypothetical protein